MTKLAEFRPEGAISAFPLSQAFYKETLIDAVTLSQGRRIVLIRGQDVMLSVEVSVVFSMKPANTKASHSVNVCPF